MKIKCLKDEEIRFSHANSVELERQLFFKIQHINLSKEFKAKYSQYLQLHSFFYKPDSRIYFTKTNWQSKDILPDKME